MKSINAAVLSEADAKRIYSCTYTGKYRKPTIPPAYFNNILTHIQLTNEACKVVVFEILGKDFACKRSLIVNQKSASILQEKNRNVAIIAVKTVDDTEK